MSNAFVFSSLLSAMLSLGLAGFATASFMAKSDDCQAGATACLGQSMGRGRSAVTEMVKGIEEDSGPALTDSQENGNSAQQPLP